MSPSSCLTERTRDSSAALERFWREARAASSLNHPGICIIHELNETAEPPFIVMELLEGSSLEKLYRGHAMPYPKLVEMGMQLADALDAAHRKGILHRDIKPANIFITNSGQAKLLDFGLAKLDDATDGVGSDCSDRGEPAHQIRDRRSAPLPICRRNRRAASRWSCAATSFRSASCSTRWRPGSIHFSGATTAVVFDRILNHAPVATGFAQRATARRV